MGSQHGEGCGLDLKLKDKTFVVGGGSKGLGRGIAQALVAEGARVLLLSRNEESLDRVVAELGPAARAVAADQLLIGGPLRLLRALVPKMDQGGAILFITSTSVRQPIPNLDTSNVLRPGVAALAKTLARELAPHIRVNSLAPGRFNTDRIRTLDASRAQALGVSQEQVAIEASKEIPFGRYGEPIELGRFAAFLLSPAASYVSGLAAQVDGAMVTALP